MPSRPARPQDWPDRLAQFLSERRNEPFTWGAHDCATFAADGVVALTGADPLAGLRGAWASEEEANEVIAQGGGLEALLASQMAAAEMPEIDPRLAQRGDVVLLEVGNQLVVGIVAGTTVAVTGVARLQFVPRRLIRRAWVV